MAEHPEPRRPPDEPLPELPKDVTSPTKGAANVPKPSWPAVDRGRSRVRKPSNPFSEESLRRKGYHTLHSSFGKSFTVERRWSLTRELGSGAYGVVISAADKISGETVAIKLVQRVFEKVQLAKRALREITLLRHFANHENITGLIDVDAISPDFDEIYIFMEPMEADLHQIIKSGQHLTVEHVQYFLYQILRGMKYIHSASVVHRDLKPGNLLVNADCELKICDFGLSRGFDASPASDDHATHLTEYVATRWYRAPEIMLAFRRYNTAIDVWSIGCIFGELLLGRPLFKGKDYVDQLNQILDVLGTPEERVIGRIGSDKAQAYMRSLPIRKRVPFKDKFPMADAQAINLIASMLTFDPHDRISVVTALEHPWLAAYHDESDEPACEAKFDKWRTIEKLETMDDFRKALWDEIDEYRKEVRGIELSGLPQRKVEIAQEPSEETKKNSDNTPPDACNELEAVPIPVTFEPEQLSPQKSAPGESILQVPETTTEPPSSEPPTTPSDTTGEKEDVDKEPYLAKPVPTAGTDDFYPNTPTDPVVTYARRSSILQPRIGGSNYNSPLLPGPGSAPPRKGSITHSPVQEEPGSGAGLSRLPLTSHSHSTNQIAFPSQQQGYVVPARTRTASTAGGDPVPRRLLRTLSTVSIHESSKGLAGGLADIAPIGKFIVGNRTMTTEAELSEMPTDLDEHRGRGDGGGDENVLEAATPAEEGEGEGEGRESRKREKKFHM